MHKIYKTVILLLHFIGVYAIAQAQQLQTVVADADTHQPLPGAFIKLNKSGDTAILKTGYTGQRGEVSFADMSAGDYVLQVQSLGYPLRSLAFSVGAGRFPALPDTVRMKMGAGVQLKEVTVKDNTPPVSIKGDTIQYNANKFKTKENAVVEDLLRKLPGVNVERDGSIKAQGETVQRVLVDGKEFFGSDPSIATRNLPADMIDRVEVLDKKSDQEEFTGVADGKKAKTINLVTKKNRKKGYFGNASAGIGTDNRYEGGFNVNSFTGDKQVSALFKANNVNKSGFSAAELLKQISQDHNMLNNLPPAALSELMRMKGVRIESDPGEMVELARPSGLTDVKFGGANFNNDWSDRFKLRSSYFFNNYDTRNTYDYNRQYNLPDTAYNTQQASTNTSGNLNQRINIITDIKLSDHTAIKLIPNLNLTNSSNSQQRSFSSFSSDNARLLNQGTQQTSSTGDNLFADLNLQLKQRLGKAGRTLMLDITPQHYRNNSHLNNRAVTDFYNLPGGKQTTNIDQQTEDRARVSSINTNILYTEPIGKHYSLQLGQSLYFSQADYDRSVYNRNASTGKYDQLSAQLSDNYNTGKDQYTSKLLLSGSYKKLIYTIGAGWQQSMIRGSSAIKGYRINGSYEALLPEALMEWKPSKGKKLTFQYKVSANAPSVNSLQPLEDNSDPLYVRKGNPALNQEKTRQLRVGYNIFNEKGSSFYVNANWQWFDGKITDSTSIDRNSGRQFTMPVNVSGNYTGSLTVGNGFAIDHNGSSVTVGLNASYSRNKSFVNGLANIYKTVTITPDVNFNYYIGNNLSLNARGNAAWNQRKFSVPTNMPDKNWLLNYSLDAMATLPWKCSLEAGMEGWSTLGLAAGYNNTILLLNTAFTKGLGKQFSLRVEARDLLNRNQSVNRILGAGYIEDKRTNALGRYFLLSAIYKFRHFPKAKS